MLSSLKNLIIIVVFSTLTGCVCLNPAHRINPPPVDNPPPMLKTDKLEKNINDLDEALRNAKSKAERVRILAEQLNSDE